MMYGQSQWDTDDGSYSFNHTRSAPRVSSGFGARRPKSVPPTLGGHRVRPDSSFHVRPPHRPNTSAGTVADCDRVVLLEHEATRKQNLEAHLPLKKIKPPPWQKSLDLAPVPCVVSPGYVLSKSKNKIHMVIKTDSFFEPEEEKEPVVTRHDPQRDDLISQLQQQIDDLTLFLEEERLNHKDTKRKAAEHLKDRVDDINNQHGNQMRIAQEQHDEEMQSMKEHYEKIIHDQNKRSDQTIDKMQGELEFVQGAFESYKSQLHQEMDERWHRREDELQQQYEKDIQERLKELRAKVLAEKNSEKSEVNKEHQKEIQNLRRDHRKEMDAMARKFAGAADDLQKLKETERELAELRKERDDLRIESDELCSKLTTLTHDLTDTKVKLLSYEQCFQDRVQEIDDKYKSQIHELMTQNTELKRLYMKKCGELFDEKVVTDRGRGDQLRSAKATMKTIINTRTKSHVSLAAPQPPNYEFPSQPKDRPCSAPGTIREETKAMRSSGETTDAARKLEKKHRPFTPQCRPRFVYEADEERPRREMSEMSGMEGVSVEGVKLQGTEGRVAERAASAK